MRAEHRAPPPTDADDVMPWARAWAERLLLRSTLVCAGNRLRICEVELYLQSPTHPDPFAHAHPLQRSPGRWYFHRIGESYRGGTFKGLDLTGGHGDAAVGWLIRSMETADGAFVDGSCSVVDHLLALAGEARIGPLDAGSPDAWSPQSRLHLAPGPVVDASIYATPRVGLTLKRAAEHPTMPGYIGRRLRFLTAPRRIRKGRPQTLAALIADGWDDARISALTGSPRSAVARARSGIEAGRSMSTAAFVGRALRTADLYRLFGACATRSKPAQSPQ